MKTHKIDSIAELRDHAIQAARMARRAQRKFTYEKRRLKSDKSVLTVRGYTASQTSVAGAVSAMARLPAVERANLDYANAIDSEILKGFDFQISCLLAKTNDPTLGPARAQARADTRSGTEAP